MKKDGGKAADAWHAIVQSLERLDEEARSRVLKSVLTYFRIEEGRSSSSEGRPNAASTPHPSRPNFSDDNNPTPKEFLAQKLPKTDVERMACLAYYLAHFRDTPYFKTLDLAKLNTEAAQPKFSNAAYTANNAANSGYLAPAPKGQRQISSAGEQFVVALPDRESAKQAITVARRRKNARRKK